MANLLGKTRKADAPYLIYENDALPGWEWRVLKANVADPHKPFASWFCKVTSPLTGPGGDLGDTYVHDVVGSGVPRLVFRDPIVPDAAIPDPARVPDPWKGW